MAVVQGVRQYDAVVFGATGFTGRRIAASLVALPAAPSARRNLAVAGRQVAKLNTVLADIRAQVSGAEGRFGVIEADVSNYASLVAMARSTRVVLNAVGPFRFFGEAVVKACIEGGADYVDITGEPEFMERMEAEYHDAAAAAGVYIISACGFDSLIAEMGTLYATECMRSAGATATSVESYLTLRGGSAGVAGHFATYESAVHGFAHARALTALRARAAAKRTLRSPLTYGARLRMHKGGFFSEEMRAWSLPFPGSDASVVRRTQRICVEQGALPSAPHDASPAVLPISYAAYFTLPSLYSAMLMAVYGTVFSLLARFAWGRKLLLAFPRFFTRGLFSHEGPTPQQLRDTTFAMHFFVRGYWARTAATLLQQPHAPAPPEHEVSAVVRVMGPEPGYVATSDMLVTCARTLLEERTALAVPPGVYTPGAVFRGGTSILRRLQQQSAHIDFALLQPPSATTPPPLAHL